MDSTNKEAVIERIMQEVAAISFLPDQRDVADLRVLLDDALTNFTFTDYDDLYDTITAWISFRPGQPWPLVDLLLNMENELSAAGKCAGYDFDSALNHVMKAVVTGVMILGTPGQRIPQPPRKVAN